ncbi:rod-binding protein [Pseudogemmobacter humi]|uniref:Rod binding protein n=1 Tax=Pseudogemmobacter humi TaxID=2483812 RepID=A0A3P5WP72_9RHOB|nr:rod-binding protein [Pseudogemmobacter humi]VDC20356.1 Rod binding protein [Pseudogemmobacter humi]
MTPITATGGLPLPATAGDKALMQKARDLEAAFLAEMLGHGGLGAAPESFGGGIGEDQFGSFLRAEQAKLMVERGGIGLAEQLFRAMGGGQE